MKEHNKASAWFDELYQKHKDGHDNIPWARLDVNSLLQKYLEEETEHSGKALVIGCGLGDDAVALENAGYEVTAIDVSQTALDLARERFPESNIRFLKQDIFDFDEKFDFVFEAFTIQSLPVSFRERMVKAVANTVDRGGRLLLVAHRKEADFDGPPWPLTRQEVDLFIREGLHVIFDEIHTEPSAISDTRFRILYQRGDDCAV